MLKTNLSTRPFYNLRAVRALLGVVTLAVLGLTLFNVVQLVRLTASQYTLGARAADAEREAARLRDDAARVRAQINPQELQVVADAAREANAIIDQRAFSWTDLLTQFEATLPPDVRITTVQPRLENSGEFIVAVGVEARRSEDLDAFIEALETEGGFRNVLSIQEQTSNAGLIQAVVQGSYVPRPPAGAGGGP
jgi:Tfp pilus assembly protein PilN